MPYLDRNLRLYQGQRQKVALGRAIVRNAKVFLMDEPLSNLDAKLRVQMRGELIKLHNRLNTTTIYVTHDQIEAMIMASRIVVMKDGYVQQVGAPKEIYDNPINIFVGGFIGTPPMNFVGVVNNDGYFVSGKYKIKVPEGKLAIIRQNRFFGKPITMGIRPEDIHDDPIVFETYPESIVKVEVDVAELLGAETNIYTNINSYSVCASVNARADIHIGDIVELALDMNKSHFFDPESEFRLVYDQNLPPEGEAKKEVKKAAPKKEEVVEEVKEEPVKEKKVEPKEEKKEEPKKKAPKKK